jgi:hypothetical protein
MMMFLPKVLPKSKVNEFKTVKTNKTEDAPRYYATNWDLMEKVNNIWWELNEEKALPINDKAVGLSWDYVDLEPLRALLKDRGLVYSQEKSSEAKAEVWTNEQQKSTVTYQPQTRRLEWITNIETLNDLGEGQLPSREVAEEKIKELVRNLSSTKTVNELTTQEISPKRLVYPRWVTSDEKVAQGWRVTINYSLMNKNIIRSEGETIEAMVGRGGKVLSLKMVWPMTAETTKTETLKLKTLEEVKGSMVQSRVWQIRGGEKTDLLYETEVSNVGINNISLVYWWEPGEKWLMPYYLLSGNGLLAGEPVGVELVTPAANIN